MLKILTLAILTVTLAVAGEAADQKLPAADQLLIDKCLVAPDAEKAYDAYQLALMKAQDKAVKDLDKVKADAMKKGNLALANAADGAAKKVREGAIGDAIVAKKGDKGDLLGEAKNDAKNKFLVGKWKIHNGIITIVSNPDGTLSASHTNGITGNVVDGENKTVRINWTSGNFYDINTSNIKNMTGVDRNGVSFTMMKM